MVAGDIERFVCGDTVFGAGLSMGYQSTVGSAFARILETGAMLITLKAFLLVHGGTSGQRQQSQQDEGAQSNDGTAGDGLSIHGLIR